MRRWLFSAALSGALAVGACGGGDSSKSDGGDGDGDPGDGDMLGDGDTPGDGDGDMPGDGDGDTPGDGDGDGDTPGDGDGDGDPGDGDMPGDGDGDMPGDGDGDMPGDGDGDMLGDGDGDMPGDGDVGSGGSTGGANTGGAGGEGAGGMGASSGMVGGGFVSDDFTGPLDDHWVFVDPLGDCTLTKLESTIQIVIPSGSSHDLWTNGPEAPQLVQPVDDEDFYIEAVFNTLPSESVQGQGIVALADSDTFVRADLYYEAGALRVWFGSVDGASSTMWANQTVSLSGDTIHLRLKREGSSWSFDWSEDGLSYSSLLTRTYAATVTQLGVFALNFGTNPATVVEIERVENLLSN